MTFGIDISTYQNGIDLKKAKNEGVNFVIIRGGFTGEDKSYATDDKFLDFYANAKEAKLNIGVYYYSRAISYEEGKNEAKFLFDNILDNKIFEYPIFIDIEDPIYQEKASKEDINNAIRGFCDYIEAKGGYAGVYCNLNWANNHMDYNELSKDYDFWLADWSTIKPDVKIYKNYGMWQFGGSENYLRSDKVDNKVCDQDYAFKDYPKIMLSKNLNNFKNSELSIDETNNGNDNNTQESNKDVKNTSNNLKKEVKETIENEVENEIKYELSKNRIKIFKFIWKWLKKMIGYIILTLKK